MKQRRLLASVALVAAVLVIGLFSAGFLSPNQMAQAATVEFFSNNAQGYACFLANVTTEYGGPYCMSDDLRLMLPANATVPLGNYTVAFFPFATASNRSLWLATNNIQITGIGAYDVSSSYANVTIRGDGAIIVFVLPDNTSAGAQT